MDQLRVFGSPPSMPSGNLGPSPDALGLNEGDGSISGSLNSSGVSGCSYGGSSGEESGLKALLTFRDLESLPRPNGVS